MPTKNQAKTVIDNSAVAIKADIDNILPVGVDITTGNVVFTPTKWYIRMNATTQATADSWANTIKTNLAAASRPFVFRDYRGRRDGESASPKYIEISTDLAIYTINGYTS